MYNWSVNTTELKKDKKKYAVWRLEQTVNFGLGGGKLKREELKKYWPLLNLDEKRKKFLFMLLWPRRS